ARLAGSVPGAGMPVYLGRQGIPLPGSTQNRYLRRLCLPSGKEFLLVFTVQKLRNSLEALSKATEGSAYMLSPVYCIAATGPMAIPLHTDTRWQPLEVGAIWGLK